MYNNYGSLKKTKRNESMTKTKTGDERMAILETKVNYISKSIDEVNEKLDTFIRTSDEKYASKDELNTVNNAIKDHKSAGRDWTRWAVPTGLTLFNVLIAILQFARK